MIDSQKGKREQVDLLSKTEKKEFPIVTGKGPRGKILRRSWRPAHGQRKHLAGAVALAYGQEGKGSRRLNRSANDFESAPFIMTYCKVVRPALWEIRGRLLFPNRSFGTARRYGVVYYAASGSDAARWVQIIADTLSEEEISGLRAMFQSIDTDNSGAITFEELKTGLKKLGSNLAEEEVRKLMEAVSRLHPPCSACY